MILAALFTRRSSSPTPPGAAASWPKASTHLRGVRFVTLLVAPFVVDFEMSHVALNASEVADDLAEAFARGPFSSLTRAVAPPGGHVESPS